MIPATIWQHKTGSFTAPSQYNCSTFPVSFWHDLSNNFAAFQHTTWILLANCCYVTEKLLRRCLSGLILPKLPKLNFLDFNPVYVWSLMSTRCDEKVNFCVLQISTMWTLWTQPAFCMVFDDLCMHLIPPTTNAMFRYVIKIYNIFLFLRTASFTLNKYVFLV